jgi:2-methylcitrate dehydratase PrpD
MTTQFLDAARTAAPDTAELDAALAGLARFRAAAARGADSAPARAVAALVAGRRGPLWTAWHAGTAAAATDPELPWVPVAAVAVALADEVTDEFLAAALAAGRHAAERVAAALGPAHTGAGWDVRSTAGGIGAGVTAARLLVLGADEFRHALGLCATQAVGLATAGPDAAALQLGKAAANAVEAALLAAAGFTSDADPLTGRRGLLALMTTEPDPGPLTTWA